MSVYIIATIISLMFAYVANKYCLKLKKKLANRYNTEIENINVKSLRVLLIIILAALPLFCVSAFRYNVGTDYLGIYVPGFNWISMGTYNGHFEIGFVLLQEIIIMFTDNVNWLFIICSFIFILFIFASIYKRSDNWPYSIFILICGLFYFESLNHVRQFLAIAVFMYAAKYIEENKFKPYLFWILFASTFHISALLTIPLFFITRLQLNYKKIIVSFTIVLLLWLLKDYAVNFTFSILGYEDYLLSAEYGSANLSLGSLLINIALMGFYSFLYYHKAGDKDKKFKFHINIQFIALFFSILSIFIPMIRRILPLFMVSQIVGIPYVISFERNPNKRFALNIIIVICYIFNVFYNIYLQNGHGVLPYQTIFSL